MMFIRSCVSYSYCLHIVVIPPVLCTFSFPHTQSHSPTSHSVRVSTCPPLSMPDSDYTILAVSVERCANVGKMIHRSLKTLLVDLSRSRWQRRKIELPFAPKPGRDRYQQCQTFGLWLVLLPQNVEKLAVTESPVYQSIRESNTRPSV